MSKQFKAKYICYRYHEFYKSFFKLINYVNSYISLINLYLLVFWCTVLFYLLLFLTSLVNLYFKKLYLFFLWRRTTKQSINCIKFQFVTGNTWAFIGKAANITVVNPPQIRKVHTTKSFKSIKTSDNYALNSIKSLHYSFINELYKNRKVPVIPFKESILAICYNCLNKNIRSEFLKEWEYKTCIYLIMYKHDPHVYYIGRISLFKKRLNNHIKADSSNKLHLFLSLVGLEHFNISIV